jgi:hypothetical protein
MRKGGDVFLVIKVKRNLAVPLTIQKGAGKIH